MGLHEIPTADRAPAHARPSLVVARLRAVRPARRTVVKGLLTAAAATTLVPIDWILTRRAAGAAPSGGEEGGSGGTGPTTEFTECVPKSYNEEANNWWDGGPATCYGGWRRGSYPCSNGYHREGSFSSRGEEYSSTRLSTNCHGRNAWRWNGYRCSDAITTVTYDDGSQYDAVTIAACKISGADSELGSAVSPSGSSGEEGSSEGGSDDPGSTGTGSGDSGSDRSSGG